MKYGMMVIVRSLWLDVSTTMICGQSGVVVHSFVFHGNPRPTSMNK